MAYQWKSHTIHNYFHTLILSAYEYIRKKYTHTHKHVGTRSDRTRAGKNVYSRVCACVCLVRVRAERPKLKSTYIHTHRNSPIAVVFVHCDRAHATKQHLKREIEWSGSDYFGRLVQERCISTLNREKASNRRICLVNEAHILHAIHGKPSRVAHAFVLGADVDRACAYLSRSLVPESHGTLDPTFVVPTCFFLLLLLLCCVGWRTPSHLHTPIQRAAHICTRTRGLTNGYTVDRSE